MNIIIIYWFVVFLYILFEWRNWFFLLLIVIFVNYDINNWCSSFEFVVLWIDNEFFGFLVNLSFVYREVKLVLIYGRYYIKVLFFYSMLMCFILS